MTLVIFIGILVLLAAALISCILIYPAAKKRDKIDEEVSNLNQQKKDIDKAIEIVNNNLSTKRQDFEDICSKISSSTAEFQELEQNLKFVSGQIVAANNELNNLNEISAKNKQQILDAENQSQEILNNIDQKFQNDLKRLMESYEDKSEEYEEKLLDLKQKRDAAIQTAVEEYESVNQRKFYMLDLSQNDIEDMKVLKQFEQLLHNKEILGKLIYKTYIEKPYTTLIGRVLNKESFSGIYKITNETNQMCYVGQAVDIAKRWKTHLKRAVGAEGVVNNKLYPAMQEFGVENFSFEVIDRCDKDKLNEREQYWQKFYEARSFGYSIK
jgi:DNA repair exonuclease SbcCD ATPase subunit